MGETGVIQGAVGGQSCRADVQEVKESTDLQLLGERHRDACWSWGTVRTGNRVLSCYITFGLPGSHLEAEVEWSSREFGVKASLLFIHVLVGVGAKM